MKLIKIAVCFAVILMLVGCSNKAYNDTTYDEMVKTIKDIEISQAQFTTFNTTFEQYQKAFEDKFITKDLEEHFIGADEFVVNFIDDSTEKELKRRDLDKDMLEKIQGDSDNYDASLSKLTKIEFSKLYTEDSGDKGTIYVKERSELPLSSEEENQPNPIPTTVIKKYIFKKMDNDWKIMQIETMEISWVQKNKDIGNEEIVGAKNIKHKGEEIEYVQSIDVDGRAANK